MSSKQNCHSCCRFSYYRPNSTRARLLVMITLFAALACLSGCLVGPEGPQGPIGPQGVQGEKGEQGLPGQTNDITNPDFQRYLKCNILNEVSNSWCQHVVEKSWDWLQFDFPGYIGIPFLQHIHEIRECAQSLGLVVNIKVSRLDEGTFVTDGLLNIVVGQFGDRYGVPEKVSIDPSQKYMGTTCVIHKNTRETTCTIRIPANILREHLKNFGETCETPFNGGCTTWIVAARVRFEHATGTTVMKIETETKMVRSAIYLP